MFGRIRTSPSSLDSLEGSPSKILKDDSFSIYEATLMKLKLGAQRDLSASSEEMDEIVIDPSISSSEANVDPNSTPASASSSQQHLRISTSDDGIVMMEIDSSSSVTTSPSFSDNVSTGNSKQRRHNNVSILHFFSKFKDPRHSTSISTCEEPTSTKRGCSGSISSSSVVSHYRSETESIQSSADCELSE